MAAFHGAVAMISMTSVTSTPLDAYSAFRRLHRSGDVEGTAAVSFDERRRIFEQRREEVERHNSRGLPWKTAVNRFADYTDEELAQNLGLRRSGGLPEASPAAFGKPSFLELRSHEDDLPEEVNWAHKLPMSSQLLRDQGPCGSCWAVAAVGVIEMYAELTSGTVSRLSTDQVIDCAPNPHHCGGTGGCHGSTSPLAMDYVKSKGLALFEGYQSDGEHAVCNDVAANKVARIAGWTQLSVNKLHLLIKAVATVGPVLVSVQGNTWFSYESGIYAGCDKDAIIGHSVALVGYGSDPNTGMKFWRIRNSWGPKWGEQGYMRLLRHEEETAYCGIDDQPLLGFGCEGGPPKIDVCGMCGILSHPSHPYGVTVDV